MRKSLNFVTAFALILFSFCCTCARPKSDSGGVIWQFPVKDGTVADYALQLARVTKDNTGQPLIEADSRGDKTEWHSVIALPNGLLKAGEDYLITLDYDVVERLGQESYFYLFIRSVSLGNGADQWYKWGGDSGARGVVKFRVTPSAGDYRIIAGIHNQGAIRIRGLRVLHGGGWTSLPVQSVLGRDQPPPPPTGAQPFTIDPPSNANGAILNVADFGAVADGGSPPVPGPDRNLEAFKAAIVKARDTKASKLIVPKGVYRFTSGDTLAFNGLSDFIFDGGGSTFLFHQIKGGASGIYIGTCNRCVFGHFNLDWDWKIDPLASVGRITAAASDHSFFEMRFETTAPLDPQRWITMNALDEKLRAPGAGGEFGGFTPKKIESLNPQTVRVWPSWAMAPKVGQLYLLRHYTDAKHGVVMGFNTHLSLQDVTIFSFPGSGFHVGGDQHHFECLRCRITFPPNERRPITVTADGFHVAQSRGFIRLEDCEFGYSGDDGVNIHDNFHAGVRRVDDHTLVAEHIVAWRIPYDVGDPVEIRNGDYSPTGFSGKVTQATANYKTSELTLVFDEKLPDHIPWDAMLFNHRYNSHNYIIRNCYFHENRARGILALTGDGLIEGNHFFFNQYSALHLEAGWSEGYGAHNVIVRNNRFDSVNPFGANDGSIVYVSAAGAEDSPTHFPLLENIIIENNLFREMSGPAVEATSFRNLTVRGNRFINLEPPSLRLKMRGDIRAELGNGLWVEGNEWTARKDAVVPSLFYDSDTTPNMALKGNQLKVEAGASPPDIPKASIPSSPRIEGTHQIVSQATGLCFNIKGNTNKSGEAIIPYPCGGFTKFNFVDQGSGFYSIHTVNGRQDLCLNISTAASSPGDGKKLGGPGNLIQWSCSGSALYGNELFILVDLGRGRQQIRVKNSGLCLEDPGRGGTIRQNVCSSSPNQTFALTE
jgi:hypothetical protein